MKFLVYLQLLLQGFLLAEVLNLPALIFPPAHCFLFPANVQLAFHQKKNAAHLTLSRADCPTGLQLERDTFHTAKCLGLALALVDLLVKF